MRGLECLVDVTARHDLGCILGSGLESSSNFVKRDLQEVGAVFFIIPFLGCDSKVLNCLRRVACKRFLVLFILSVDVVDMGCLMEVGVRKSQSADF